MNTKAETTRVGKPSEHPQAFATGRERSPLLQWGVIGGAGPLAGARLVRLLLEEAARKGAWKDRDFPVVHLDTTPWDGMEEDGVHDGPAAAASVARIARSLSDRGAQRFVVACHSVHAYLTAEHFPGPWCSLTQTVLSTLPHPKAVWAVVESPRATPHGYAAALERQGRTVLRFPESDSEVFLRMGMGGREEETRAAWYTAEERLRSAGAECLLVGCSDLGRFVPESPDAGSLVCVDATAWAVRHTRVL